jgi:hypothetical protein
MCRWIRGTFLTLATGALALACAGDAFAQFGGGGRRGRGGRRGPDKAPKVGTKAPDFKLKELDVKKGRAVQVKDKKGKKVDKVVKLTDVLKDGKPVALIFGSYT